MLLTPDELEKQREKLAEVLEGYIPLEVGESKLYLVGEELDGVLQQFSDEVLNYLNPSNATGKFSTGLRGKYKQITQRASARKYIEADFAVWRNVMLKEAKEKVAALRMDDAAIERLNESVNSKIETAKGELKYILDNYDNLEVKITGFKHASIYPYVQFATMEGDRRVNRNIHLCITIPNALLYTPTLYRADMSIETFVKAARNPFGDVFYLPCDSQSPKKEE
jgi:hypothetical protein